jgi:hypothetical protein
LIIVLLKPAVSWFPFSFSALFWPLLPNAGSACQWCAQLFSQFTSLVSGPSQVHVVAATSAHLLGLTNKSLLEEVAEAAVLGVLVAPRLGLRLLALPLARRGPTRGRGSNYAGQLVWTVTRCVTSASAAPIVVVAHQAAIQNLFFIASPLLGCGHPTISPLLIVFTRILGKAALPRNDGVTVDIAGLLQRVIICVADASKTNATFVHTLCIFPPLVGRIVFRVF